jgi:hypothetical protein
MIDKPFHEQEEYFKRIYSKETDVNYIKLCIKISKDVFKRTNKKIEERKIEILEDRLFELKSDERKNKIKNLLTE